MIRVNKLSDINEKSDITHSVLRDLPEWFEKEESIIEYIKKVKYTDFYVAYVLDQPVGFISIKMNNKYTSEVYVMGVYKEYHNYNIGSQLIKAVQKDLVKENVKFIMLKTLGSSNPDKYYELTRKFFKKVGFYPIDEYSGIWDAKNPCLIMAKSL